eukprot:COSAG01_NODE_1988_length_8706_cov_16.749506_13_plen_40_part_00
MLASLPRSSLILLIFLTKKLAEAFFFNYILNKVAVTNTI